MENQSVKQFKPFVDPNISMPEFTVKAILLGVLFGVIFGASTVYLALKAGLTVSASIPIAVLAISLGTTILENNIIQTTGSAGESIAAGVVFTLPAFLFLSDPNSGAVHFQYWTIFTLAVFGGVLGTLMMIPLRRSLIVKEHDTLPYPEGTACAQVLIAGEKGGDFAKSAFYGLGFAMIYAIFQKVFHIISELPSWGTQQMNKYFPSAVVSSEITPEYLGVGYIIGPKIAGVLVAGGIMASLGLIPLLSYLVAPDVIAAQLAKLNLLDITQPSARFGWDPVTHTMGNTAEAVYRAYIRQIGAGAVAAGGFITLLKTIPTIVSSFKESISSMKEKTVGGVLRTEDDLSFKVVLFGSLALVLLMAVLPQIPGTSIISKLLIGILIIVFGFFFVTVSSRIVGIIGSSNNPISGMTIATIICIAAANAGATSQDLKTGYLIGATPRYQQLALFIGAIFSSIVIGFTVKYLDTPTAEMAARGITHAIGEKYAAPQATLMATLIKGLLSFNLDWTFVLCGVFIAIVVELCQVKALSFAVGLYLPLSTTLPIFIGGAIKGLVDWRASRKNLSAEDAELGKGSLFATGLVAGGALAGVIVALLTVNEGIANAIAPWSAEHGIVNAFGQNGYHILGVLFFAFMGWILYKIATRDK